MRLLARLFLPIFGLIFVVVGLLLAVLGSRGATAAADRAEALQPIGAAALDSRAIGDVVLIEGTLSPRNPTLVRSFVAFSSVEYRGREDSDGDPVWESDERITPPLLVEAGGLIQVANDDYQLDGTQATWQDRPTTTYNGLTGDGTKRYRGLESGQIVTVIGAVVRGAEGNELQAEFVAGGTRAAYIAGQRDAARFLPILGAIFCGVGLLITLLGTWLLLRGR